MDSTIVEEVLKLPAKERLELVELLCGSLSGDPSNVPPGDAHWRAIDQALDEHRADPDDVVDLETVLRDARSAR